jgi:CBS domain-containing protein
MSPRAACRLETLGFKDVHDYVAGKLDWMAAGLPTEGSNAQLPRAADLVRTDPPTCGLDERLGDVRKRAGASGWDVAVVVSEQGVVLGLLRRKELDGDPDRPVEQAMRPGPSTFRPFVPIQEMATFMEEHRLDSSPITTSDGRLAGLLLRDDALQVARDVQDAASAGAEGGR